MKYFAMILAQLAALAAMSLWNLGVMWIDIGHGIHPMAAGVGAVIVLLAPYALVIGDSHD